MAGAQLGKGFLLFLKTDENSSRMAASGGGLNLGRTQYHSSSSTNSSLQMILRPRKNLTIRRASLISSNLGNESTSSTATTSSSSSCSIYVDSSFSSSSSSNRRQLLEEEEKDDDHQEKLHEWMEYSVAEIVKNIEEAPLFMHVYGAKTAAQSSSSSTIRIEKEKAVVAESWPRITRRWQQGSTIPDGIILVEQLHQYDNSNISDEEVLPRPNNNSSSSSSSSSNRTTTAWGVLVQGRGDSCCACYILKTCRVRSSLGFCTHFCLARAKCFGEIAELQLKNSWLHHHTWQ